MTRLIASALACALSLFAAVLPAHAAADGDIPLSALSYGPSSQPFRTAAGSDGVWFTERAGNRIGHLAIDHALTQFDVPTPNSGPYGISLGDDGTVWFTESQTNKIGALHDGTFREYPIPTPQSQPTAIVATGDSIWFAEMRSGKIGRLRGGAITEIALSRDARPSALQVDGSGDIWFAELGLDMVGQIHNAQVVGLWKISDRGGPNFVGAPFGRYRPNGIAITPSGALLVTASQRGLIIRMQDHVPKALALSSDNAYPYDIVASSDSDFWFTEPFSQNVVHVVNGVPQRIALPKFPCRPPYPKEQRGSMCTQDPTGMSLDKAGDAWVAESNGNAIAEITADGKLTEFPLPVAPVTGAVHPALAASDVLTANLRAHVRHVIFIVQENRSFDDLFANFPHADGATGGFANDAPIPLMPGSLRERWDLDHIHDSFVGQYNGGAMNGFYHGYFHGPANHAYKFAPLTETQPYWDLAAQFGLADRFFEPVSGPSYAAHLYLVAAQTGGVIDLPYETSCYSDPANSVPILAEDDVEELGPYPCYSFLTLADLMDYAGVSWRYYLTERYDLWDSLSSFSQIGTSDEYFEKIISPSAKFITDLKRGGLADFTWVIPDDRASDHAGPRSSAIAGPEWVASVVNAVGQSQYWNDSAIFITWDDWGGFFDHVKPPSVGIAGYGFRVPLIVVSPYAKRGFVSHTQHEFGSVLRFAEEDLGVASLGQGDSRSDDLLDMFDFAQSPLPYRPVGLSLQHERVFDLPEGIAYDSNDHRLFVTDLGRKNLWSVALNGDVRTFGASPFRALADPTSFSRDSNFEEPYDLAYDEAGHQLYVADSAHDEIVRVSENGETAATFSGAFLQGGRFDDRAGSGVQARFYYPMGISIDPASRQLYISDTANERIKQMSQSGSIVTLAGSGRRGTADGTGDLASFNEPLGLAYDPHDGAVYVATFIDNLIRRVGKDGQVTTFAGDIKPGGVDGTGSAARFFGPVGIVFDSRDGDFYVSDSGNNAIRRVTPLGVVTTLAGGSGVGSSDGVGSTASFYRPTGIAYDKDDDSLYVVDSGNALIRHVSMNGRVQTLNVRCVDGPAVCWDASR
jgi:phospholipase C/streptogramin lyase